MTVFSPYYQEDGITINLLCPGALTGRPRAVDLLSTIVYATSVPAMPIN